MPEGRTEGRTENRTGHRVVVTGLGILSPIGIGAKENWDALMAGRSGIGPITQFDATAFASRIAGEVKGFQAEKYLSGKDLKKMDRFIQLSMVAGAEAIAQAGLDFAKASDRERDRVGTCVGVGLGGLIEIQAQYEEVLAKGPRRISPFFIPQVIGNLAAGQLSIKYALRGPSTCITTACSSSAHALGESYRLIQRGDVDVMVAGGAESTICALGVGGFCAMRALSERNDSPATASRPFDRDRDGFVIGEGAAILILESLDHAKRRGATILAEMVGYGLNADGFHMTQPAPEGEGGARCMLLALKDAQLRPDQVQYVNAHGTSTPIGDVLETTAIKKVFGDHAKKLAVSSTKSMTGHLLGGAGAVEALYCVQAIQHQALPPTMNLENPSPECDLDYIPNEARRAKVDVVLSNSFGFGGTNGSLIFRAF